MGVRVKQELSTEIIGFVLILKNGNEYRLSSNSGEKLEQILVSKEMPKFIRIKADDLLATISVSMIAELKRDVVTKIYRGEFL
jgi:hypothetical protein